MPDENLATRETDGARICIALEIDPESESIIFEVSCCRTRVKLRSNSREGVCENGRPPTQLAAPNQGVPQAPTQDLLFLKVTLRCPHVNLRAIFLDLILD